MIKKAFVSFFLLLAFLTLASKPISAQELNLTPGNSEESTSSPAIIKYNLPFPGILPDQPLYKLKVLRDKISLILISNPLKKIEFYLLQADKGILATAILVDKNKIDLAEQTALKAEHNMTLISGTLNVYYRQQQTSSSKVETKDLIKKLKTASLKHQEVLSSLLKRVPEDRQKTFETVIYFSKSNISTIEKIVANYETDNTITK